MISLFNEIGRVRFSQPGGRPGNSGFTLVEIVVVLIIVGLAVAFSVPTLSRSLDGLTLRKVVREMTAAARHARGQAMIRQRPHWIGFDLTRDVYWLEEGLAEVREKDGMTERERLSSLPPEVDLNGFRWADRQEATEVGWIQFYPNGSSSGGSFSLVDRKGKEEARVSFEIFTGIAATEVKRAR